MAARRTGTAGHARGTGGAEAAACAGSAAASGYASASGYTRASGYASTSVACGAVAADGCPTAAVAVGFASAGACAALWTAVVAFGTAAVAVAIVSLMASAVVVFTFGTIALMASVIVVSAFGTIAIATSVVVTSAFGTIAVVSVARSVVSAFEVVATASVLYASPVSDAASVWAVSGIGMANHRMVHAAQTSVPNGPTVVVVAAGVVVATVSAPIVPVDAGMMVEVVAVGIVVIDGEVPSAVEPPQGTEQIIHCCEGCPLPVVEDVAQVVVTVGQIACICQIGLRVDGQQVVEVDFVRVVILLVVQVQLVGHFVRQVVSPFASGFIIHSTDSHPGEECNQSHHVAFHSRKF